MAQKQVATRRILSTLAFEMSVANLRLKNCCEYFSGLAPGVDVVVAIFCHF
jgi:hypothetical protein